MSAPRSLRMVGSVVVTTSRSRVTRNQAVDVMAKVRANVAVGMARDGRKGVADAVTKESGVFSRWGARLVPAGKGPGFPGYRRTAPVPTVVAPHDAEDRQMIVPLTIDDFLQRAETAFADTVPVIAEPNQPAAPVPTTTYRELARRVRAWQAGLDALGVAPGERVAVVSQNSARLLELLYAVPASGRVVVPINFRLRTEEVRYIVEHSGASVLLVDPELDEALRDVRAPQRIVLGAESEALAMRFDVAPRPWTGPDENATATINYTSGTTARPKGVQLTHRNLWMNAVTF